MNARVWGFLVGSCLGVGTAGADEVYRWVDVHGGTHYTNDLAEIPSDRRGSAAPLREDLSPPASNSIILHTEPAPGTRPRREPRASAEIHAGHTEDLKVGTPVVEPVVDDQAEREAADAREAEVKRQWQTAFRAALDRVERAKAAVAHSDAELARIDGVIYGAQWEAFRAQSHDDRVELQSAHRELDRLEHDASAKAIPREWRQ